MRKCLKMNYKLLHLMLSEDKIYCIKHTLLASTMTLSHNVFSIISFYCKLAFQKSKIAVLVICYSTSINVNHQDSKINLSLSFRLCSHHPFIHSSVLSPSCRLSICRCPHHLFIHYSFSLSIIYSSVQSVFKWRDDSCSVCRSIISQAMYTFPWRGQTPHWETCLHGE